MPGIKPVEYQELPVDWIRKGFQGAHMADVKRTLARCVAVN